MGADPDGGDRRGGTSPFAGAARRAVRTTVAACAGFYLCLYGLHEPVAATYALFAAVAMAGLSHIPGTGRQQAAVVVRLLPVAWVLVTAGTYLAVRTWSAVAGMLLIGFALAFVAAAGPRPAGAAPGLQLLYILPCFPPYAPDTLGARLAGATLGIGLLILAEVLLLPESRSRSYRELAAEAAGTAARCAAELERAPFLLSAASTAAARAAGESLRPSRVPEAERPAGPGLRERALAHTGLTARTLLARLADLPAPAAGRRPTAEGPDVLLAVSRAAAETGALLSGAGGAGDAVGALRRTRAQAAAADREPSTAAVLHRRAALLEVADAAVTLSTAADLAVRGRRAAAPAETDPGRFWYAGLSWPRLWWHRLAGNAGPRSVYFQNAVRISLALAAARTVAGLGSLPHGFWAMLATLTLTRTTVAQTGATVRQALAGTLLGALAAAVVLALVGSDSSVYALALPIVMLVAFCVGPVRGVGWAQGLFTLVVAVVFAQLAPVTWRLAGVRVLDVVVGSMIGMVFGVLAWPRGGQGELHRAVVALLETTAATVESTADAVAAGGPGRMADDRPLQHTLTLAESAFAQAQSELRVPADGAPDWQAALMAGHHALWGSRRLLGTGGPALGPETGAWVQGHAAGVAGRLRLAADQAGAAASGVPPGTHGAPAGTHGAAVGAHGAASGAAAGGAAAPEAPGTESAGPAASAAPDIAPPQFFAALTWLDALRTDLDCIAAPGRSPRPA